MLSWLRRSRSGLVAVTAASTIAGVSLTATHSAAEVTYEQILAAPDDAELNLQYAREQVATGRLQQAAAALERILLQRPNWDSVRLFYGVVLYRLDDVAGAKREFELLEGRNLSPSQEADRLKYLARATKKSKSWRVNSRYSIGTRYDTNPGRVSDAVAAATGADDDGDFAFAASSRFRFEADIDNGRRDYFFFQSNGQLREFLDVDRADLISSRGKAGFKLHHENGSITPYAHYSSLWLQGDKLRTSYGGGLDTSWTLNSQVSLQLKAHGIYEDYDTTSYSAIGSLRDGWRAGGGLRLRWRPSDSVLVYAGAYYNHKDASFDGFSYDSTKVRVSGRKLLGMGRYITGAISYENKDYEQPDGFYSPTITRKDDIFRVRAATGAPLSAIFAGLELPHHLGDIVAQVGGTYHTQDSSIPALDIDNFSVDLTFTKRFSF